MKSTHYIRRCGTVFSILTQFVPLLEVESQMARSFSIEIQTKVGKPRRSNFARSQYLYQFSVTMRLITPDPQ
ncbi:MAG: hypothetical protein KME08_10625 [Aphanothece sp. CMT-3BRIN-NPC111]|nr:hypothetical protein [Aphanothece sp. CMT-3BRIN-NPC111]